jgi:hypothetical protein
MEVSGIEEVDVNWERKFFLAMVWMQQARGPFQESGVPGGGIDVVHAEVEDFRP